MSGKRSWFVCAVVVLIVACAGGVVAEEGMAEGAVVLGPDGAEWTEIVPGIDFAAAYGAYAEEAHGKWVRFDPGVTTPVHVHSNDYHGVVIQGTVVNPYQDEEEPAEMGPGTYWFVPAGSVHTTGCVSEEPCLFYTHGDDLWDLEVIEDEPSE